MNRKQTNTMMDSGSPSQLIQQHEASQMSLNPSYLHKPQLINTLINQAMPNNKKKRLKFDQIVQDDFLDQTNKLGQDQSQQQIEIQFHLSNCLKGVSNFIKSEGFSYLYVIVLVLFLVNSTLEAAQISTKVMQITQKICLGFQIFFTLSLIIKFTQYQNQHIFWLLLDFITNTSGYLAYGFKDYQQPARYFRAIKILRLLMIVKESTYLQRPAAKLITSLSSVGKILFPAALFIYFYAIIGLYSFRDYQYSKCRDPSNKFLSSNWTVYSQQIFLCGQKQCPIVNGVQYECLNPIDYGVQPNPYQVKNIMQGNGLMRYNNIFYSLFSTFKQTFITGSSRLMILGKQVTNYFYVLIYYLSFVYLLAYIYLNIFYGLMITNQQQAEDPRRQSSFQLKLQRASQKKNTTKFIQNKEDQQTQKPLVNSGASTNKTSNVMVLKSKPSMKQPQNKLKKSVNDKLQNIKQNDNQCSQKSDFQQVIDFNPNTITSEANHKTNKKVSNFKVQSKISKFAQQNYQNRLATNNNPFNEQNSQSINQSPIQRFKQQTYLKYGQIMKKYFFINHIIVILCSINILIDYEGQTYNVKLIVDAIDFGFFWVYMFQMVFRLIVHFKYVPKQTIDKAFKLDLILFGLCAGGLLYEVATAQHLQHFLMASDDASKLLRTLKYLRIFILISSTPYFNQARIIFNSTLQAVYSVRYLSALWLLVLITFSVMGYHMFHGKTKVDHQGHLDLENGHPQNIAFEGIVDSFIYTVFIFFNQEWDWFLFQQYVNQQVLLVIWQLIVLVIGLQVLSKYFMALLMKQLGDKLNEQQQLAQIQGQALQEQNEVQNIMNNSNNINKISPQNLKKPAPQSFIFKLKSKQSMRQPQFVKKTSNKSGKRMSINTGNGMLQIKNVDMKEIKRYRQRRQSKMRQQVLGKTEQQNENNDKTNKKINLKLNNNNQINSINVNSQNDSEQYKHKLFLILKSKVFIIVKIIVILISIACTLVMSPHQDPNSQKSKIFTKIWYTTVAFFTLQMILSIFAFGLINKKTGYIRNAINWIYFIVLVIQILSIIPGLSQTAHFQALLSFRVLRIFVFVQLKYEYDADMRLTMVGFKKLLPKLATLIGITLIMYGFFAIILVKLYKDDYYFCQGYDQQKTILTQLDCMSWGGNWIKRRMNVSNIFQSLLYLFLVATTQGWSIQVIQSASLTGKGNQPSYGHSIWMEYFFSVFFFFGNMIMLNVFIGLSVYNFQKIKSQVTGIARLSKDNKMWFSIKNTIHRLRPKMKDTPPQNCLSQLCHSFMTSKAYKIVNTLLLVLFAITMSLYRTNLSAIWQKGLNSMLYFFFGAFIADYIMHWFAYGLKITKKRMFIFYTVGVIYFIVLLFVTILHQVDPKLHRILYGIGVCILCLRCFALLNEIQFVRKMINSLVSIFPQTSNIWLLIFVVLFSYAVIGIYNFGYLKISPQLNEFDQNYINLPNAIYALIKFSTLQSPMLQIIDSTAQIQPNSVCFNIYKYQDYVKYGRMGCGNPVTGYIFFLSFHIIYSLILLSTLLAVIVDAYSQVRRQQQSMVNKFQLQQVQKQWENYDPEATGYISYRDFWMFTAKLVKIYKFNKQELLSHQTKQSFLKSLQIPIYQDQNGVLSFQFHEVVEALTRVVVKQKMGPDWNTSQADKVFKNHNHHQSQMKLFRKSVYDSSHVLTLIILKSGLKVWKRKAVNVQNQQNLQNLFTFAKKQKQKVENNNQLLNQTLNLSQNKNNEGTVNKLSSPKENIQQLNLQKSNNKQKSNVNHKTSPLLNQNMQNNQSSMSNLSINQNLTSPQKGENGNMPPSQKISTSKQTNNKSKFQQGPSSIQRNKISHIKNITEQKNQDQISDIEELK